MGEGRDPVRLGRVSARPGRQRRRYSHKINFVFVLMGEFRKVRDGLFAWSTPSSPEFDDRNVSFAEGLGCSFYPSGDGEFGSLIADVEELGGGKGSQDQQRRNSQKASELHTRSYTVYLARKFLVLGGLLAENLVATDDDDA